MDRFPLAHARRGAVFGILAALLLANPLYIGMLIEEPRTRSPTGYTATAVDPANASDQQYIIQQLGNDEILHSDELSREGQYDPYGPRYQALDRAGKVIRRAHSHENGSARTTNGTAAFTLHRFGANHRYTAFSEGNGEQYYRLTVTDSNESTVVTLEAVSRATVAQHVVYSDAQLYTALPRYQRETIDKVIASESGYRPYNDEFGEITDDLVIKNGTYYVFRAGMHVDDFGPSRQTIAKVLLYALGFLLLIASILSTMAAYRSEAKSAEE